eukprot:12226654-Alexandrium_andersonii.AAC.1
MPSAEPAPRQAARPGTRQPDARPAAASGNRTSGSRESIDPNPSGNPPCGSHSTPSMARESAGKRACARKTK